MSELCAQCNHEMSKHDPEDQSCDAFSGDFAVGVCRCGRERRARDDYPYIELSPQREQWKSMCDELDRLRAELVEIAPRSTAYDEATNCPVCPMLATDRDDALHNGQLMYLEQQRWQEMAEDLWEELQWWHHEDCPTYAIVDRGDTPAAADCTCHRILAAKWDEITNAADWADDGDGG